MSRLPFPISDSWTDAKPQIEELLRILYEERIGGLKTSSIIVNESDEARLSEGDANRHLLMNADADGHEWVNPHKIGTFTRAMNAASGSVSYTGVGFKPSVVIFFAGHSVSGVRASWGFSNGTNHYVLADYHGGSADTFYADTTTCILLYEDSAKIQYATISSMDSDGFTLAWTKADTPAAATINILYLAFR